MAFIIKPLVTEKMTNITEKRPNRFGFIVSPEANKLQIKKEVEAGLIRGQKASFKKAIVTLKEGDTIDFYSNI